MSIENEAILDERVTDVESIGLLLLSRRMGICCQYVRFKNNVLATHQ